MKKRVVSLLLAGSILCGTVTTARAAGTENFKKTETYGIGTFGDVEIGSWYQSGVINAYELGLMKGVAKETFAPGDNITVASALALACRLHCIYTHGKAEFVQGNPWYQVYVNYASAAGIIAPGQYTGQDLSKNATRRQFAGILAKALPVNALENINVVEYGGIPDVKTDSAEYESIYLLYRAGVLTGSDKYGTFHPENLIDRASVAAVVSRMAKPELRRSVTLEKPMTPEQVAHLKALEVLRDVPYYGDPSKCRMTPWQAHTYAQLIADGIGGKSQTHPGLSWEKPFEVNGYDGPYRTDRNQAVLGDFAGDGNPYLYLRSSKADDSSYDVYGWQNGKAVRLISEECWHSRRHACLREKSDGTVVAVSSGSDGAASHSGEEYSFRNGGKVLTLRWEETFNHNTGLMEETINGVKKTYTREEWNQRTQQKEPQGQMPFTEPDQLPAVSLRTMLDGLNRYAEAASQNKVHPAVILQTNRRQQMAKEMLRVLDDSGAQGGNAIEAAVLVDMNGDGLKEMVCSSRLCGGAVYCWQNGALQKKSGEGVNMAGIESVIRHKPSGTYGIRYSYEIGGRWTTVYTSGTHLLTECSYTMTDPPYTVHREYSKDGKTVNARQHTAALKEWETVKNLFVPGAMLNRDIRPLGDPAHVRTELNQMLIG